MSKGRFLNQKLGKRTTRKIALLKSRIKGAGGVKPPRSKALRPLSS